MATKQVLAYEITADAKAAEQSVGSFRTQLRAATQDLVAMAMKFGDNSVEAQNAGKKVAMLRDAIGDAKAMSDTFNPDKKFVALGGAIQGVVSGFSAYSGAMGLLGSESKDVEKILLKVQSAMALQQGISGIAGAIDSFKLLGGTIKNTVVKAFSTLKGAIIGTGIGALIVGIGLLIANFESVKKAVLNFIPGLAKVGEVISNVVDWFTDLIGVTSEAERAQKKYIDSLVEGNKIQQELLDNDAGKYDEFTKKKIKAKIDYNNKLIELDKIEGLTDEERLAKKNMYIDQVNFEILESDKARSAKQQELKDKEDAADKARNDKRLSDNKKFREDWQASEQMYFDWLDEQNKKKADDEAFVTQLLRDVQYEQDKVKWDAMEKEAADKTFWREWDASEQMYYDDLDLTNEEARVKAKEELHKIEVEQQEAMVDGIANALDTLADIAGRQTTAGKVLAIAVTTINTIKGAISAFTGMTEQIPGPVGIALGVVAAAGVVASGVKAVKQITAVKIPRGGGGGGSTNIEAPKAPITPQASTTKLDAGSINAVGAATSRSYVLESDVSGNQERITRLNRAARIN